MTDVFDSGNALVFHYAEIAASVNRKPQPEKIEEQYFASPQPDTITLLTMDDAAFSAYMDSPEGMQKFNDMMGGLEEWTDHDA
jgi:hypothetical protein